MKVLVILGEGGHTTEILQLVEALGPIYDYSYLIATHDQISESKIKIKGPVYRTRLPRGLRTSFLASVVNTLLCSIQQFSILLQSRPRAILSAGAGIAVPISLFGRLLGVKIIHIETACRVRTLSLSGRILYHIAHLFFVQWEPLKKKYPKAIYAGRWM